MREQNFNTPGNTYIHIDDIIDGLDVSAQWKEKFKAFNAIFYNNYEDGKTSRRFFWKYSPEYKALTREEKMKFSPAGRGTCAFLFGPVCQILNGSYLQGLLMMLLLFVILSITIAYPFSLLFTLIPSAMLVYFYVLTMGMLAIKSWWALFFAVTGVLWFFALRTYAKYVNIDYFYKKCLKNPDIYSRIQLKQIDLKPREDFIKQRIEKNSKKPLMFRIKLGTAAVVCFVPILFLALWNNQVEHVENMADYPKQLNAVNMEIRKQPEEFMGYAKRAVINKDAEDEEKALEDLTKAIELKDNDYKLYLERARLYMQENKHKEVIKDTTSAMALLNRGEESEFDRYLHKKIGASFSSLEAREKAIMTALRLRGRTYMKMEQYENAIVDFDTLISIGIDNIEYYLRGISKYRLGDHEGALEDFEKHKMSLERRLKNAGEGKKQKIEKALKKVEEWIEKTKHLKSDDLD